ATWTGSLEFSLTNNGNYFYLADASGKAFILPSPAHAGAYHFKVAGVSGSQTHTISLPGSANGIPPVRVANYVQAQAVDASQPFDLQWQKVSRRGAGDSLALTVYGPDGKQLISQS